MADIAAAVERSQSPSTQRAYAGDWARFEKWCQEHGYAALPAHPATVAAYLVSAARTLTEEGGKAYAPSTLGRWLSAIADRHRRAGVAEPPTAHELVRATLAGIRRQYADAGERRRRPRAPLLTDDIVALVAAAREDVLGWADAVHERRDSALLLIGYASASRRSELGALCGADVALHEIDGLHIQIRRSKSDQEGQGLLRAVPRAEDPARCTACAAVRWAEVVAVGDRYGRPGIIRLLSRPGALSDPPVLGHACTDLDAAAGRWVAGRRPFFRAIARNGLLSATALSGASVHSIIQRRATRAGYSPEVVEQLGGHSLRAGFVTQAMRHGADAAAVMRQTGHSTEAMVHRYRRETAPLLGNAVNHLGL
nr:tyrosine-type recombinase/integrase [Tsukamurella pulmonis]